MLASGWTAATSESFDGTLNSPYATPNGFEFGAVGLIVASLFRTKCITLAEASWNRELAFN
jgi:hypothetical protein